MAAAQEYPSVQIFGHRGAGCSVVGGGSAVPENSFAAFERAAALGLNGVELDVWLTKDEQVVVVHGGGSDLEGYLYETVVDLGFHRELYHREKKNTKTKVKRRSSALQDQIDNTSNYSWKSGLSDATTEKSFSGTSSTSSNDAEHVVVEIDKESRLRRIEEIVYAELQRAGELKLREPWTVFRNKHCETNSSYDSTSQHTSQHAESSLNAFLSSQGPRHSKCDPLSSTTNLDSANSSETIVTADVSPLNATVPMRMRVLSFERPTGSAMTCREFHRLTTVEKENESIEYHEYLSAFVDSDNTVSEVPLLADVFKRFHGRLRFNVELKGTNPRLGQMVLDLARPYPGIIARVSSFLWGIPGVVYGNPKLAWDDDFDGPRDLLLPILNNPDDVPIALLFEGYQLPSISKILKALQQYHSEWIHLPQSFLLGDAADAEAARQLREELHSIPGFKESLETFPREAPPLEETSAAEDEDADEGRPKYATTDSIELECLHLYYLTQRLHEEGHKVLVYGGRANEVPALFKLSLLCGVDGLCPNNVSLAFSVSRGLLHESNNSLISNWEF